MLKLTNIKVAVNDNTDLLSIVAGKLSVEKSDITEFNILRKSIDARKKDSVCYVYSVSVCLEDEDTILNKKIKNVCPYEETQYTFDYANISSEKRPVIIGTGPAGLFCALMLSRAGLKPIVAERGSSVDKRTRIVEEFRNGGELSTASNIQFGEGGAGTFSDGKLTCGLNDKRTGFVLKEFVKAGAPREISYLAKPHIGTDYLKNIVKNMRLEIESLGGEVLFDTCLTDMELKDGRIASVELTSECTKQLKKVECDTLILAIGHSSRDTYTMLWNKGFNMTRKPFSVGVRIEHKREYINLLQYKAPHLAESLPAADYKLSCHPDGRGVYSFCMCPGGEVVCGSSEEGGVVTNGMSFFARDMANSNSALLVSVYPEDIEGDDVLGGMYFQQSLERAAYKAGGGNYFAPCQRVGDFIAGIPSQTCGEVTPSYLPGVRFGNLWNVLPDFVAQGIKKALAEFDKKMQGFKFDDALLTGVETRSSAPVRIVRDENMLSSFDGVYPIGEGAGYAGGIMSAALDGIKCAEKICERMTKV